MSIGLQLRQAREAQSMSLEQVAQATHIRLHFLEALEADNFDSLPSAVQVRGFIRSYADYLKLNSDELIRAIDEGSTSNTSQFTPTAPKSDTSESPVSSEVIFKEIGGSLRSQRELMGLSLEEVERHTHIRMHYIQALETGNIAHLPSPVQGRGMLSNYAAFLGLNTETILLRFADGLQADLHDRRAARITYPLNSTPPEQERPAVKPSLFKRLFSMDLFVASFLIVFLVGFSIWGALHISRINSDKIPSPTAPSVADILLSTPRQGLTGTPALLPSGAAFTAPPVAIPSSPITGTVQSGSAETQVGFATTPGLQNAAIQVNIVANQRAWMRVIVDGKTLFEGRVVPGSAYSFAGNERIDLLTGEGSGLRVYYNQQDLGLLGSFGEAEERIFTLQGVQTPTPSVPPTRTPVPTGTVTPTSTGSPVGGMSTPTPTPKP